MQRISNLITKKDIKEWNPGDVITIHAPTDSGKSHFIKNGLYDIAKSNGQKILMLLHRRNPKDQFQMELEQLEKTDVLDIYTYQSIENDYRKNRGFDFNKYDWIVSDEYHYWFQDSLINKYSELSFNAILNQTDKVKIMMSATGNQIKKYINKEKRIETRDYRLIRKDNRINKLVFFNTEESYHELISEFIKNDEKTMFFIDNNNVVDLYKQYRQYSMFNCGDSYKKGLRYRNDKWIESMLKEATFDRLFLFTTSVMDAGTNIRDKSVKNIVVDMVDVDKLIQCIGRRRFDYEDEDDVVNIYVRNISNKRLNGYKRMYINKLKKPDAIIWGSEEHYVKEYGRDNDKNNIVYSEIGKDGNIHMRVNELRYYKLVYDLELIDEMMKMNYMKYISRLLGKGTYKVWENEKEKETIEDYLKGIEGKKLFDVEQQELSDLIIKELITLSSETDYRTKRLKPSTLETIIRDQLGLPFGVSGSKKESKGEFRGKRYITITELK